MRGNARSAQLELQSSAPAGLSLQFEHDALGNVVSIQSPGGVPEARREYGYDALSRIVEVRDANQAPIDAYTYDATGNRLSRSAAGGSPVAYAYAPDTDHSGSSRESGPARRASALSAAVRRC